MKHAPIMIRQKTVIIGRETPIITFEIFRSIAEKEARKKSRADRWQRIKDKLAFRRRRSVYCSS